MSSPLTHVPNVPQLRPAATAFLDLHRTMQLRFLLRLYEGCVTTPALFPTRTLKWALPILKSESLLIDLFRHQQVRKQGRLHGYPSRVRVGRDRF